MQASRVIGALPKNTGKLLLLTSIFFLNFLSRIILSPLLPQIKRDLALSTGQVSGFFFFLSLGYFSAQLGSGFVSERIGHKNTIFISVSLSALFLFILGFTNKLGLIIGSIVCLGLATGLYLPSAIATITSLFDKDFWGRAVSVHELAPNLAFISAPVIASIFLERYNWHVLMMVMALCCLIVATVIGRTQMVCRLGTAPGILACKKFLSKKEFYLMLLLFGLGITSTIGIYNMLPIYLVSEHGFTEVQANYLVSMSRVATLGTALLGGYLSDLFGPKRIMGWVLLFTGTITFFLGITSGVMLKAVVFVQPLLAVCFFPAAFSCLSAISSDEDRNLLISMIIPFAFVMGAGIMPTIIGWMADYGLFQQGFMIAGAFLASGMALSSMLPISEKE